jgi:putative peptidoglycan lipid II flippase
LTGVLRKRIAIVSIASTVTVAIGFLREATLAYWFGAGAEVDAFLIAITLPQVISVEIGNLATAVIVPYYIALQAKGNTDLANDFAVRWIRTSFIVGVALATGYAVLRQELVDLLGPGLSLGIKATSEGLILYLCAFFGLAIITQSTKVFLDARRSHVFPALSGSLVGLSAIASVILTGPEATIYSFVLGLTAGAAVVLLIQGIMARDLFARVLSFAGRATSETPRLPLEGLGLMGLAALSSQAHVLIDRIFASNLHEGSVSALHYASTVLAVPGTVAIYAIGTVLLPELGRLHAEGHYRRALEVLRRTLNAVLWCGLPMVIVTIWFALDVVRLLFQRGTFSEANAIYTASILAWMSPMLLLSALATVLTRQMMATSLWRAIAWLSIATLVLKVSLNALLVAPLGAQGLALSSVLTSTCSVAIRYFLVFRR